MAYKCASWPLLRQSQVFNNCGNLTSQNGLEDGLGGTVADFKKRKKDFHTSRPPKNSEIRGIFVENDLELWAPYQNPQQTVQQDFKRTAFGCSRQDLYNSTASGYHSPADLLSNLMVSLSPKQFCGSVTWFWIRGSVPYLWLTLPDPAIFVSDLRDGTRLLKIIFLR